VTFFFFFFFFFVLFVAVRDHATCRLTAKNQDQLRNLTLGNRVLAVAPPEGREGEASPLWVYGKIDRQLIF